MHTANVLMRTSIRYVICKKFSLVMYYSVYIPNSHKLNRSKNENNDPSISAFEKICKGNESFIFVD